MTQLSLGMGGHHGPAMESDEWLTPPEILKALGPFDLDPCAPVIRPWAMARDHYTVQDNGLMKPWYGRVWCNPPYGGPEIIGPWMRRMAVHGLGTALIFARTETEVFFDTVFRKATGVLFLRGRLHFHYVDGRRAGANAGAPSALVAYGEDDAALLRQSGLPGVYVPMISCTLIGSG